MTLKNNRRTLLNNWQVEPINSILEYITKSNKQKYVINYLSKYIVKVFYKTKYEKISKMCSNYKISSSTSTYYNE